MQIRVVLVVVLSAAGLLLSLGAALAQQTPSFEAASVKRNTSGERSLNSPRFQGTTLTAVNVPLEMLITVAYGIPSRDLMDAPGWVYLDMNGGERYDVVAKAAEGRSAQDQRAMLRHMLEDRFGLRLRREQRQLQVFTLTTLDERGALGPNLRPAAKNCLPRTACEGRMGPGHSQYKGADWSILLQVISQALRQERVVDRTGLSGLFDFELTYNPKALSTDAGDAGVDIFGAVRQQLGLKLEPGRAPFEIAVIEAVRRPTPD